MTKLHIGTAGWTIPKEHAHLCPPTGTHLERFSRTLNCLEINSSFYRPHMPKTWERWAASTPENFRFSVKAPKAITHEAKLCNSGAPLAEFFSQITGLGKKLGPILFQLPPKQLFDEGIAREFLATVRELHSGPIAIEPRNATWFTPAAAHLLRDYEVARVAADPPKGSPLAAKPAGTTSLRYYRLHGAPRVYWSPYSDEQLATLAADIEAHSASKSVDTWVIFDNTASGDALSNALKLHALLQK